jgi:hypothetical protein
MPTIQQTNLNPRAFLGVRGIEAWLNTEGSGEEWQGTDGIGEARLRTLHPGDRVQKRGNARSGEDRNGRSRLHTRHSTECRSVARIGTAVLGQAGRGPDRIGKHTALYGAQQPAEQRLGGALRGKEGIGQAKHTMHPTGCVEVWQCPEGIGEARLGQDRRGQARQTHCPFFGVGSSLARRGKARQGRIGRGAARNGSERQPTPRAEMPVEDF